MSYQVPAEADKPETDSGQDREAAQSQTFASSPLALQFIANAFRRAFTVTNPSSNTSSAVIMCVWNLYNNPPSPQ